MAEVKEVGNADQRIPGDGEFEDERTAAAAWRIILFNIGAVASPLAVANAAAAWGPLAFFVLMAIPQALFALALIGQVLSRRRTQA